MNTIDNIIEFCSKKETEDQFQVNAQESMISYPTEQEISVMNALIQQYSDQNPDEMMPFELWNGDCYHSLFDEMVSYAEEIGVDPWDAFALFIKKFYGWRMEEDSEGGVTVKYNRN